MIIDYIALFPADSSLSRSSDTMISSNPFADLSAVIPNYIMQGYVVAMFLMVIGGTILDMVHKRSAQYFFANSKKAYTAPNKPPAASGTTPFAATSSLTAGFLTNLTPASSHAGLNASASNSSALTSTTASTFAKAKLPTTPSSNTAPKRSQPTPQVNLIGSWIAKSPAIVKTALSGLTNPSAPRNFYESGIFHHPTHLPPHPWTLNGNTVTLTNFHP